MRARLCHPFCCQLNLHATPVCCKIGELVCHVHVDACSVCSHNVLCCAVLCCAVLCCAVLCCAVLCCAVLCCAVLYCAVCKNGCCDITCTNLACEQASLPSCRFAVTVIIVLVVCHGLHNSDLQPRKAGGVDHMTHVDKAKQVIYILLTKACIAILNSR